VKRALKTRLHSVCDSVHMGLIIHTIYLYLVTGFGDFQALVRDRACHELRQFNVSDMAGRRSHVSSIPLQILQGTNANPRSVLRSLTVCIGVGVSFPLVACQLVALTCLDPF
jgi:hypothetical protein